jgi:hypothetical protein
MGGLLNGRHTADGYYTTASKLDENLVTENDDQIDEESKEET